MRYLPVILLSIILFSCSGHEEEDDNVLLKFGDQTLTYEEVLEQIPHGLMPADSAILFNAIVEGWIRDMVLCELAEERLYDLNSIERKVKDYRNSLIVQEYLSRMRESHRPNIEESKVKDYYDRHRKDLKLEVPLIKGVFLKINAESPGKEEIKNLISSDDPEKIDRLEQVWLDRALEYNYFRDKWIDWETITALMPHRVGDPDMFLKETDYLETQYGDCAYYLKITDYLPSGEEQPFEFARGWITDLLTQGELTEYENSLVASLVNKALNEKKLQPLKYDPLKHEITDKEGLKLR